MDPLRYLSVPNNWFSYSLYVLNLREEDNLQTKKKKHNNSRIYIVPQMRPMFGGFAVCGSYVFYIIFRSPLCVCVCIGH